VIVAHTPVRASRLKPGLGAGPTAMGPPGGSPVPHKRRARAARAPERPPRPARAPERPPRAREQTRPPPGAVRGGRRSPRRAARTPPTRLAASRVGGLSAWQLNQRETCHSIAQRKVGQPNNFADLHVLEQTPPASGRRCEQIAQPPESKLTPQNPDRVPDRLEDQAPQPPPSQQAA
jgi:hypothetical protein